MKLLAKLILSVVVVTLLAQEEAPAGVQLKQGKDTVSISINGKEFAVWNFKSSLPKPFMFPVRGEDGTVLTREIIYDKSKGDHPHHKGIWVAVDEIDDIRFWAEDGKIANREVELLVPSGNPAQMKVVNDWQNQEGKAVVTETTVISIWENRLLGYDIRFSPSGEQPVKFGDTKEGLFGFRMVHSMRESEGGKVVNHAGDKGTKACWGRVSDWIDYTGPVNGKTFGVALFDHPLNFRRSRYHVRNYGLFSISPFGERAYTSGKRPADNYYLFPGNELRLRYGLFIHSGTTEEAKTGEVYLKYLKSAT